MKTISDLAGETYLHRAREVGPTMANPDRFIVLIDCMPDVGELPNCFHLTANRRTINGFTTSSPVRIVEFLKEASAASDPRTRRRFCVMDRYAPMRVIGLDSIKQLVTEAYILKLTSVFEGGLAPSSSLADREGHLRALKDKIISHVNSIPFAYRPSPVLLLGETPVSAFRSGRYANWQISPGRNPLPTQVYENEAMQRALAGYMADPAVSADSKQRAYLNLDRFMACYHKAVEQYVTEAKTSIVHDLTDGRVMDGTAVRKALQIENLIRRALSRIEHARNDGSHGPSSGIYAVLREVFICMLNAREDICQDESIRCFIKNWLADRLNATSLRNELHMRPPGPVNPESSRRTDANKKMIASIESMMPGVDASGDAHGWYPRS